MSIRRFAASAVIAAGLAALPLAPAKAQYYPPLCNPFPLTWPFCIAGAVVYGVGAVVTAPFRAFGAAPYYGYYPQGYYYAPPPPYLPPAGAVPPPGAPVPPPPAARG